MHGDMEWMGGLMGGWMSNLCKGRSALENVAMIDVDLYAYSNVLKVEHNCGSEEALACFECCLPFVRCCSDIGG